MRNTSGQRTSRSSHEMGVGKAVAAALRLNPHLPSLIWIRSSRADDVLDECPAPTDVHMQSAATTLTAAVRLSIRLASTNSPHGTVVALLLGASDPSPWLPVTTLAIWLAGYCVAYVSWSTEPLSRRRALLEAVQPGLCVSFGHDVDFDATSRIPHVQVTLKDVWPAEEPTLDSSYRQELVHSMLPSDWAVLSLTSGTTGKPKSCLLSHEALLRYASGRHAMWPSLSHFSRIALVSSPTFDPYVGDIVLAWTVGAPLLLGPTPGPFIDLMLGRAGMATHITSTPAALLGSRLLEVGLSTSPWLEAIALGGESIPKAMQKAFKGRLWNLYGTTEMGVYQTAKRVQEAEARPMNGGGTNCGRVLAADVLQILIVVREQAGGLHEACLGDAGEVAISGKILDHTAYVDPVSGIRTNHSQILSSGIRVYMTGDLGKLDPASGDLWISGRVDDQVKVRGIRVALSEVEALLSQAGSGIVTSACALMTPLSECDGDKLVAVCSLGVSAWEELKSPPEAEERLVLYKDAPLTAAILGRARQIGAAALLPAAIFFSFSLPTTKNGKVDRPALISSLRLFSECRRDHGTYATTIWSPLRTLTEAVVSMAWGLDLNIPPQRLGRDDMFVALGGDSLVALRTARRLEALSSGASLDASARYVGGKYGDEGIPPWANPCYMLGETTLCEYSAHLDRSGAGSSLRIHAPEEAIALVMASNEEDTVFESHLPSAWEALVALACRCRRKILLSCLLGWEGVSPNGMHTGRNFSMSPLSTACRMGATECAKLLLEAGANPNTPDAKRRMPLHACAEEGRTELISLLLTNDGIHLHARDQAKQTALHHAARGGCADAVAMIASAFKEKDAMIAAEKMGRGNQKCSLSSLDWRDRWARTAVHWACVNNHPAALHALLEAGAVPHTNSKKLSVKAATSLAYESPMDICERVNGPGGGACGALLLRFTS